MLVPLGLDAHARAHDTHAQSAHARALAEGAAQPIGARAEGGRRRVWSRATVQRMSLLSGGGPWSTLTANSTPCVHSSAIHDHARSSTGPSRQEIFSCDHGNRAAKRDDRRTPASRETWVLEPRAAERTAAGNALVWCAAVSSASPHHSSASPHRASEQSRITDLAWELVSALSSRDDAPTEVDPCICGRAISVVSAQW